MSEVVVMPGLGATKDMYQGPWLELENCNFVSWPRGSGIKTLDALADWVCEAHPQARLFAGSSLGGMIALLCASKMKHKRVVLMGSATSFEAVSPICQKLQPLSKVVPFDLAKLISGSVPMHLVQMYAEQDAELMKHLLLDMPNFDWSDDSVEVTRIHGAHDGVIDCPEEVDLRIDGRHLVAMSHAQEICDWLRRRSFC